MITYILKKIFGTKSERDLRKMMPLVRRINTLETEYQKLTDEELKHKTVEFKERLAAGETTRDLMCEAFAVVKNACRRMVGSEVTVCGQQLVWDMVPFDVQILGGIALEWGNIAEMATGEGKTLVATMPLYLNALTGKNCQLVTVNDYLAQRDSEWMGAVYRYLGLTVGCLKGMMPPDERREQYNCDITYGTNSEFGFDYLRDMGMAVDRRQLVQRDHYYAIIDEIDSILIDEARTPLIISGPVAQEGKQQFGELIGPVESVFNLQSEICSNLAREAREILENPDHTPEQHEQAVEKLLQVRFGMPTHKVLMRILEDGAILKEVERFESRVRSSTNQGMLQEIQSVLYFTIDEKGQSADLTERGRRAISPGNPEAFVMPDLLMGIHAIDSDESLTEAQRSEKRTKFEEDYSEKSERLHSLSQLLKAYCLFERDVHYVVQQGKVMIVDEHTGRLMPGRRFNDGLHQALEAKEKVKIEPETQTLATITIQNYFRMYEKLAGMTGTAETEANEFHQIYKLDVVVIPTNKPCRRVDVRNSIFKTKREKFSAIVEEVTERFGKGQPVLLGTISVEDSEILSRMLKRNGIPHNVLNAKNNQHEAEIVARAGQRGAVTVATNMAGRGTDIKLGAGVVELGGLYVIGSSRHDSRRIDRQLRGRCSRQGDPGESKFYVSLEDNLMRLFGSDRIIKIFDRFGIEEGDELQSKWLDHAIETAQQRVEQQHFAIRKRTLDFDDVMNKQREVVYGLRKTALLSDNPHETLFMVLENCLDSKIEELVMSRAKEGKPSDFTRLVGWLNLTFPIPFKPEELTDGVANGVLNDKDALVAQLSHRIEDVYNHKNAPLPPEQRIYLARRVVIDAIDHHWQLHLYTMDHLRTSINLRVYAQKDPLVEYKQEAYKAFDGLITAIENEVAQKLFYATVSTINAFASILNSWPKEMIHKTFGQFDFSELLAAVNDDRDGAAAISDDFQPTAGPKRNKQ